MDPQQIDKIRNRMSKKTTEELLAIWTANDHTTYLPETFVIVSDILVSRNVMPPPQNAPVLTDAHYREPSHDVYVHASGRVETIKNGFSWPAFFFGCIWAWTKGMVGIGFGLLGLSIIVNYVTPVLFISILGPVGFMIDLILGVGVSIWVGMQGNRWRRNSMPQRGFQPAEYVDA